jgi:putative transposase
MPYGLKRFQKAEALHFITFSCFHRLPLLEAPQSKDIFEAVLEETRARHQARIYAYVLMPEHVHLLINEPPAILLGQFLKSLKQMTSRKLKGDLERFWQDRYFDRNVRGEDDRSEVIRYIHRNPLRVPPVPRIWGPGMSAILPHRSNEQTPASNTGPPDRNTLEGAAAFRPLNWRTYTEGFSPGANRSQSCPWFQPPTPLQTCGG